MTAPLVDARVPRITSAMTAALVVLAFALGFAHPAWGLLVPGAGLVLFVAWLTRGRANVVTLLARPFVRPPFGRGTLEDARPPRFAQLIGWVFLGIASLALFVGEGSVAFAVAGWAFALLVAGLALLNAATGFCLGCRFYILGRHLFADRRPRLKSEGSHARTPTPGR
jgi:hypothetical protein